MRLVLILPFPSELLQQYGVRLNVLGKKELLPASVQAAIREAEQLTAKNNRYMLAHYFVCYVASDALGHCGSAVLNICMPYASRDDMTSAVEGSVREALEADPDVLCVFTEKIRFWISLTS